MLKVQVSFPELKAHAQAIRDLARDPMTTLQGLVGGLRPGFEEWLNDSDEGRARSAPGP